MKGSAMQTMYLVCAVLGGTVLVCQFVMTLLGIGGDDDAGGHDLSADHDIGHDHSHGGHDHSTAWFVGILTFRTIVAALTFFGIGGMAATTNQLESGVSFALATATGVVAMFSVAWLMRGLHRLKAEGTVRIDRAIGATGSVYLTIPAQRGGLGKVTLNIQNRTMEYQALTAQGELPTGTRVVVTAVVNPGTVEVAAAEMPAVTS